MILYLKTSYIVFIIKNKIVILLCEYILKNKNLNAYIFLLINFQIQRKLNYYLKFFSVKISKTYNFNKNVGSSYLIQEAFIKYSFPRRSSIVVYFY
jgi:hypothetical protein